MKEALRLALNVFEPEGYSPTDTQADIARTICTTLGITREMVADLASMAPGVGAGCTCADCDECRQSLVKSAEAIAALLDLADS